MSNSLHFPEERTRQPFSNRLFNAIGRISIKQNTESDYMTPGELIEEGKYRTKIAATGTAIVALLAFSLNSLANSERHDNQRRDRIEDCVEDKTGEDVTIIMDGETGRIHKPEPYFDIISSCEAES